MSTSVQPSLEVVSEVACVRCGFAAQVAAYIADTVGAPYGQPCPICGDHVRFAATWITVTPAQRMATLRAQIKARAAIRKIAYLKARRDSILAASVSLTFLILWIIAASWMVR